MDPSTPLVSSIIQVIRPRFHRTPLKIKRCPLAKESQKNKISSSPPPATRPESASSASPPSQVHICPTTCQEDPHHHHPHPRSTTTTTTTTTITIMVLTQVHPGHYLPFPTSSAASAHSTGGLIVPQPINATKVMRITIIIITIHQRTQSAPKAAKPNRVQLS